MTAPRRVATGSTGGGVSTGSTNVGGAGRDWAHDRGEAFAQLLEHLPTDHLHSKTAATVVVTLDIVTLRGQLKVAGPAVLDGKPQPLNLGRLKRLFSEAQRVAGALKHTHCSAEGCQIPYAWCELHHRQPWSRGGRTDLRDMIPLWGFHHRRIHQRT